MTPVFVLTLGDVIGLVIVTIVGALAIAVFLSDLWQKARCKHDGGVNENSACDAICRKCGKNLGFIGAWNKK